VLPPNFLAQLLPKDWLSHNQTEKTLFKSLISYAAADAFGAFYEFNGVPAVVSNQLKAKPNWPYGGISDDTALTLLTLIALAENSPEAAASKFLELLRMNVEKLRGLGPTTRAALGLEVKAKEMESVGATNGGLMRTCLVAMAFDKKDERDTWLRALISVTHKSEIAIQSALELGDIIHNRESNLVGLKESSFVDGVPNTSKETLTAVRALLSRSKNLEEVIRSACLLGGDTDTTAAVSSAIYSFWHPESDELFTLPWLGDVNWSELENAPEALSALYRRAGK
jgi:ADP-ribosylglycohydrolase